MAASGGEWRRPVRWALGASLLVAAVQTAVLAPLSWDGAYLFAQIVDRGLPYTPHGRVAAAIPQLPAVIGLRLGGSVPVARYLFAAGYSLWPFAGLWLAWRVARAGGRPDLFVWPAITTLALLVAPAWFSVSEAVLAAGIVWVLWLGALLGFAPGVRLLPLVASAAVLSLHPLGAVAAAVAAFVAVGPALLERRRPRRAALAAALLLTAGAVLRAVLFGGDADEAGAVDARTIVRSIGGGMQGPQLVALGATAVIVLCLVRRRTPRRGVVEAAVGVLVLCNIGLAAFPEFWHGVHGLRYLAMFLPLPLVAVALLEQRRAEGPPPDGDRRRRLVVALAAGYALALGTLGWSWWRVTDRLETELAAQPAGCIDRHELPVEDVLSHWSTSVLALALEGPVPRVVVTDAAAGGCARWRATGEIPFEPSVDPMDPDGPWRTRGAGVG